MTTEKMRKKDSPQPHTETIRSPTGEIPPVPLETNQVPTGRPIIEKRTGFPPADEPPDLTAVHKKLFDISEEREQTMNQRHSSNHSKTTGKDLDRMGSTFGSQGKERTNKTIVDAGHKVSNSPNTQITNSPITVEIVSEINGMLSELEREIDKDEENGRLDQMQARDARSHLNHIKQEVVKVKEGKSDKAALLNYLKKIMYTAGYVTEKLTAEGPIKTMVGNIVEQVRRLPGFR